ncbi:MAG TPA: hypothetical protein VM661_03375 [Candidatus Sulfotelmatobacter sp.]|jgi:uncharacterized membrane protein|nr:hypothetical protein [Candidatus Sulfotelmatobacter sp.]
MTIDDLALARAIHVLCVMHWMGGVAFITLVILPLAKRLNDPSLFSRIEHRFSGQVKLSIPLAGASGLYMTAKFDLWSRFGQADYWWMTTMFALWIVFMLMVFVVEPLVHVRFERLMAERPATGFAVLGRVHQVLLALAVVTVLGAVAGAHGWLFF